MFLKSVAIKWREAEVTRWRRQQQNVTGDGDAVEGDDEVLTYGLSAWYGPLQMLVIDVWMEEVLLLMIDGRMVLVG